MNECFEAKQLGKCPEPGSIPRLAESCRLSLLFTLVGCQIPPKGGKEPPLGKPLDTICE